jgi:ubiquinone/menaquinone biosynthesis C-methylase UbiE
MAFDPLREPSERCDSLQLLPEQALLATSAVDHADWNYRPILGRIQRLRFDLIRSMLRGAHARRLLEIGYGSGIFFPELAKYADDLHGIDPHPFAGDITRILSQHGIRAKLVTGTAARMPYADSYFQAVVAVSALEFVDDLAAVCREVKRILEPGGILAIVTPANSPILDLGVRVMTGASPQADFQDRRQGILPRLYQEFVVDRRADYPPFAHGVRLYTALRLSAPGTG